MVNVAILGFGVVGSGVAEVLAKNGDHIDKKVDNLIRLKYILDVRDFPDSPFADKFVKDFSVIEDDPDVNIVVETIGGARAAKDFTERALKAGKSVVTSNKELVAEHGYDLLKLAEEHGVSYLFEASVGGGIPIIRPLNQCLAANEISEICGILNGTTNYILTRMIKAGLSFDTALKEAQANGYAEQDPTADVEGVDAGRKICILADLAFGHQVEPERVPMEGIRKLSLRDVRIAQRAGYRIKLLGRAVRLPGGGRTAYVAPHLISEENPVASVEDVFNAVVVRGNATGEVMFYGRGAGELPTASACVADVMECLQSSARREEIGWSSETDGFEDPAELKTRYYFRIEGSLTDAAMAFGQVEVLSEDGETAFLTDSISGTDALRQSSFLNVLACMRVLA
mgnify:CR=1 FL=1